MFENYVEMLTACGIASGKLTLSEVYHLATNLMHDGEVRSRRNSLKNTATVVREMSVTERAALRDRVLGVAQIGAAKTRVR